MAIAPQDHSDDSSSSSDDDEKTTNIQSNCDMIVAVGTYDGSIAAFEVHQRNGRLLPAAHEHDGSTKNNNTSTTLQLMLASPVHDGSVRSLAFSHHPQVPNSCIMVSTGYDDVMKPHDFATRRLSTGDIRTTSIEGTPTVAVFAPPPSTASATSASASSHLLVGFGEPSGQVVLYKRNANWTAQHVLTGHEGGIAAMAVHPTGKLAVSCGRRDGKIKVWDLERGRLAYATAKASRLQNTTHDGTSTIKHYECIDCIVWKQPNSGSNDGAGEEEEETADCYAFSYGSHITVRTTLTGKDLLDVDLPAKVNEVCLMNGPQGLFVAAACNDGSLPVLYVQERDGDLSSSRRAIMAMEPSDGKERFKFIKHISQYRVVVASNTGVVHLMDLQGAVNMILNPQPEESDDDGEEQDANGKTVSESGNPVQQTEEEEEEELAVEILDSKMVGSGATRISSLAVWVAPSSATVVDTPAVVEEPIESKEIPTKVKKNSKPDKPSMNKRKAEQVELDDAAMEKARALVSKAKKIQKKRNKRKNKSN